MNDEVVIVVSLDDDEFEQIRRPIRAEVQNAAVIAVAREVGDVEVVRIRVFDIGVVDAVFSS